MVRDPVREAQLRADLGEVDVTERPMFGGLALFLNDHMLAAARNGRMMFRVGSEGEADALAHPGTERMTQTTATGGRHTMPGYVWLTGPALEDDALRRDLARAALTHVAALPPKKGKTRC